MTGDIESHEVTEPLPPYIRRPHVVIVGAGASRAACPRGDRGGVRLPVMRDLASALDLASVLVPQALAAFEADFESAFAAASLSGKEPKVVAEIERRVSAYFAALQLPDRPTVYDHLVLCLREKDVIASFNWDPLLVQAIARNAPFAPMPRALFLHGNVAVGTCLRHRPATQGTWGVPCFRCGAMFERSKLLYPVTKKNYQDPPISLAWKDLQTELRSAFVLTIFGYSAPSSDVEAVKLLQEGWGPPEKREFEEVEIIDIAPKKQLRRTWRPFYFSHHYEIHRSFYESAVAMYPRRSVEHTFSRVIHAQWQNVPPLPRRLGWKRLREWFAPLVRTEREAGLG